MAEVARKLADAVLEEAAAAGDAALQRSAAQIFACAASIGSDAFAATLSRGLCQDMASNPLAPRSLSICVIKRPNVLVQWIK